ncbi:hypothetical protein D3C78_1297130 [compost metagenome]
MESALTALQSDSICTHRISRCGTFPCPYPSSIRREKAQMYLPHRKNTAKNHKLHSSAIQLLSCEYILHKRSHKRPGTAEPFHLQALHGPLFLLSCINLSLKRSLYLYLALVRAIAQRVFYQKILDLIRDHKVTHMGAYSYPFNLTSKNTIGPLVRTVSLSEKYKYIIESWSFVILLDIQKGMSQQP